MLLRAKKASTDYPIHEFLAKRWSPDEFAAMPVSAGDLRSLFEAARWAASSYNEQPWTYIVATKDDPEEFTKMLSCLERGNQSWARFAPVLALAGAKKTLTRNGSENRAARHDLGLASANVVFEATSRGLVVHQMIGILPEKARLLYNVPEDWEILTALAIGYPATAEAQTEAAPRRRKPIEQFVFRGNWGTPAPFIDNGGNHE